MDGLKHLTLGATVLAHDLDRARQGLPVANPCGLGHSGGLMLTGIRDSVSRIAPPAHSSRLDFVAAPGPSLTAGALDLARDCLFPPDRSDSAHDAD
jgi:hypothetical protein